MQHETGFRSQSGPAAPEGTPWYKRRLTIAASAIGGLLLLVGLAAVLQAANAPPPPEPHFQRELLGESSPAWLDGREYAAHEPRFLADGGLLLEGASENRIEHSERFSEPYWTKADTEIPTERAPGPTRAVPSLAHKVHEVDGASGPKAVHTADGSMDDTDRTYTVYAKADGRRHIELSPHGPDDGAKFDLEDGTVYDVADNVEAAAIEPAVDGWYRCRITVLEGNTQSRMAVYLMEDSGTQRYVGQEGRGVLLWGAQAEPHRYPTSYIPTSGEPVDRQYEDLVIFNHGMSATEGTLEVRLKIDEPKPNPEWGGGYAQTVWQFNHNWDAEVTVEQTPRLFMYFNFTPNNPGAHTGLRLRALDSETVRAERGDHVNNVLSENDDPNGVSPFEELLVQVKWKEGNRPFYEVWINGFLAGQADTATSNAAAPGEKPVQWPQQYGEDSLGPLFVGGRPIGAGGRERRSSLNGRIYELRLSPVWRDDFPDMDRPLPHDGDTLHLFDWQGTLDAR